MSEYSLSCQCHPIQVPATATVLVVVLLLRSAWRVCLLQQHTTQHTDSLMATPLRSTRVYPPEKGSFPIDHDGVCEQPRLAYMQCLRNKLVMNECRSAARAYLQCRIDQGLMVRASLDELGFATPLPESGKGKV